MFTRVSSLWQYSIYSDMCYGFHTIRCQLTVSAILLDLHASVAM